MERRTYRTKGAGSREAGMAMEFKIVHRIQKHWRRLNGNVLLSDVIAGIQFEDGVKKAA